MGRSSPIGSSYGGHPKLPSAAAWRFLASTCARDERSSTGSSRERRPRHCPWDPVVLIPPPLTTWSYGILPSGDAPPTWSSSLPALPARDLAGRGEVAVGARAPRSSSSPLKPMRHHGVAPSLSIERWVGERGGFCPAGARAHPCPSRGSHWCRGWSQQHRWEGRKCCRGQPRCTWLLCSSPWPGSADPLQELEKRMGEKKWGAHRRKMEGEGGVRFIWSLTCRSHLS
jgi:hypothetical protein